MSQFRRCPSCRSEAKGGWSEVYIDVHKCNDNDHKFCNKCKSGDRCPNCQSPNISWNYGKAYTDRG